MSTILVTGNYVVGANQSLSFGEGAPAYTLDGQYSYQQVFQGVTVPDPNFTDNGSIQVTSTSVNGTAQAFADNGYTFYFNSLIKISQGASLTVSATGAGSFAYGYNSGDWPAAVENDGTFSVSAVQTAVGASLFESSFNGNQGFKNTGVFSVSAQNAVGVTSAYAGAYNNSGTFTVTGQTVVGFNLGSSEGGSFTNSGTITVTADPGGTSAAIVVNGFADTFNITNTGTITAQTAIRESNSSSPAQTPILHLTNSGAINGDIILGEGPATEFSGVGQVAGAQIHNTGAIYGAVHLDLDGNDLYDGRGGTQTGGIYLGNGIDTVFLGDDGETVHGGGGNSIITGGAGGDTILGSAGAETVIVGSGADVLDGGTGTNTLSFASATASVTLDLTQSGQQDTGFGHKTISNFQNLLGSTHNDVLTGDANNNVIDGGGGDDVLDGGLGVNTISFASATVGVTVDLTLQGLSQGTGAGNVTLSHFQNIVGTSHNDVLTGDASNNVIDGGAGGNDILDGGGGINTASFASATVGVAVDLSFQGSTQNTGEGAVSLTHFQNLIGSAFNDTLAGDANDNVLDGGAGTNTVSYAHAGAGVTVSLLLQGQAQDTVGAGHDALSNFQNIIGSDHGDTLTGDANANHITGGAGNDVIDGGGGSDVLDGGGGINTVSFASASAGVTVNLATGTGQIAGSFYSATQFSHFQNVIGSAFNDVLTGDAGNNVFTGGGGADAFMIGAIGGSDTITDFTPAGGDQVNLSALDVFFTLNEVLAAATQSGNDTVIDLGGGRSLTLDNVAKAALTASDFVLAPITVNSSSTVITIPADASLSSTTTPLIQFLTYSGGTVINNGVLSLTSSSSSSPIISTYAEPDPGALFENYGQVTYQGFGYAAIADATTQNFGTMSAAFSSFGELTSGNLVNSGAITVQGGSGGIAAVNTYNIGSLVQNLHGGVITVSSTGASTGADLIYGGEFDNAGTINVSGSGQSIGVLFEPFGGYNNSPYFVINNSGQMTVTGNGGIGIEVSGYYGSGLAPAGQYNLVNSGTITASTAIQYQNNLAAAVDNSGILNGDVVLTSQDDRFLNTGVINGNVSLGGGADSFDSSGGTVHGVVTLGTGNATVLLGAENDTVVFGGGNPVVTGGGGADTFVFAPGVGNTVVTDFSYAQGDTIDLSRFGTFNSLTDILAHSTQVGANVVLALSSGSLTLDNVTATTLTAVDFGLATASYSGLYRGYGVVAANGTVGVAGGLEGGANTWTNGRVAFADGYLATSPTDTAGEVYRLYEGTLGRSPDPEGLAGWVHALNTGAMTLQQVADGFVNSGEFQTKYGMLDNTSFVTLLYNNILGRAPDAQGLAGWVGFLNSGADTRSQVVLGFTQSAEDITALTAPVQQGLWIQDTGAAEVARLYDATLGRLPDQAGEIAWTRLLDSGTMSLLQVTQGFVGSAEFQSKYGNLDNIVFVTQLYESTLHRQPDVQGLADWVGFLNSGADTRAQVVLGFSESAEHIGYTAPHIDNGVWFI